jgi:Domain of unknown function DUF11
MRHSSFRLSIATLLVLGGCAAALAIVSGSKAGASTNSTLRIVAHPTTLSVDGKGFAKASFTAASGSGTGAATHVVITVVLPSVLTFDQTNSSTGCSADSTTTANDVVCTVGTVNPGETANRFVTFTAPHDAVVPPAITASATQDNGNGGNGGGGGSSNTPIVPNPLDPPAQVTVVAADNPDSAGNCLFGVGTVKTPTPDPRTTNNQSTGANVGTANPSLGIPCAYADVGEDTIPNAAAAGFVTQMSHDNIAQLTGPATITIKLDPLPVTFNKIVWRYFPTYNPASPPTNISQGTLIGPCTTDGKLPTGKDVCLLTVGPLSPVKSGNSGTWNFLQNGTGSDPGFGS